MVFAGLPELFHLANAAMLPLTASVVTMRIERFCGAPGRRLHPCPASGGRRICTVGGTIRRPGLGRRPLLFLASAPFRFAAPCWHWSTALQALVAVQVLDGVSATVLAVLVPLIIADVTRGTGHFNLAQGTVGTAVGIGASSAPCRRLYDRPIRKRGCLLRPRRARNRRVPLGLATYA